MALFLRCCACGILCYLLRLTWFFWLFFFFNYTATTEIYTLSLHDALPIFLDEKGRVSKVVAAHDVGRAINPKDRKSTRLNSSHTVISYAVFCLKKKN